MKRFFPTYPCTYHCTKKFLVQWYVHGYVEVQHSSKNAQTSLLSPSIAITCHNMMVQHRGRSVNIEDGAITISPPFIAWSFSFMPSLMLLLGWISFYLIAGRMFIYNPLFVFPWHSCHCSRSLHTLFVDAELVHAQQHQQHESSAATADASRPSLPHTDDDTTWSWYNIHS